MDSNKKEVLVTYSWDSPEHQQRAASLVELLRKNGFAADIDLKLSQEQTAIDFTKMMHKSFVEYDKIIIILSKGYKEKAESFKGGVGTEYKLMLEDIEAHPKKYILVSLESFNDNIIPLGLKGREIVDLIKDVNQERLLRKLLDSPEYHFSEVAGVKPVFGTKDVQSFTTTAESSPIIINDILSGISTGWHQYSLIKRIESPWKIEIQNKGNKAVQNVQIEVTLPKNILQDIDEYSIYEDTISFLIDVKKIHSDQRFQTPFYKIIIRNDQVSVINEEIIVKVFCDDYPAVQKAFKIRDFVKPISNSYNSVLSEDMFLPLGSW